MFLFGYGVDTIIECLGALQCFQAQMYIFLSYLVCFGVSIDNKVGIRRLEVSVFVHS